MNMPEIISSTSKELTLTNEIRVDDKPAYSQSVTISSSRNEMTISQWPVDIDLYISNKAEIRKLKDEFEDMAIEARGEIAADANKEEGTAQDGNDH